MVRKEVPHKRPGKRKRFMSCPQCGTRYTRPELPPGTPAIAGYRCAGCGQHFNGAGKAISPKKEYF